MRQVEGVFLDNQVFLLSLGDVLIDGSQLLLERIDDQLLSAILIGGRGQVFRRLQGVGVGAFLAFGVAPCDCLSLGRRYIGFSLASFGHVVDGLLTDLLQARAFRVMAGLKKIGSRERRGLYLTQDIGLAAHGVVGTGREACARARTQSAENRPTQQKHTGTKKPAQLAGFLSSESR